jgi:molecular chaperone DnaJ
MITVPPGTESGLKIRLKGQGGAGRSGAPPGDLLVTFQVQPDRFFRYAGRSVTPINLAQAVFGTRSGQDVDGKKVVLRISRSSRDASSDSRRRYREG